jgi:exosome complex component RRP42
MGQETISHILKDYIYKTLTEKKRIDGRGLLDYRKIEIEPGFIEVAEGSARVKLGNTDVLAGVKMSLGEPFPDTPDMGVMTTNAELIPMASPTFEAGPPDENSIELSRVVDRGLREGEIVDMSDLCIEPGEKVWIMFIDVHVLDYDGNLFDASALAAVSALASTKVPASQYELGDDYPLPIKNWPIMTTFAKINDVIIADPGLDEEKVADARLSVYTDQEGRVRAMQKGLNGGFTYDEVKNIVALAKEKGNEIRKIVMETVNRGD